MSRKSSRALFSSIYENDVCVLGNNALDYTKTKNITFIDDEDTKPDRKKKKQTRQEPLAKPDPHAVLNKGAISRRIVHCSCNKCHEPVEGTMINYIQLSCGKSIPFVVYTCLSCGHAGHRSVQAKALPHDEFDRLYFT